MKPDNTPVDDYIAKQPQLYRKTLVELQTLIRSVVPQADEVFSYQVGCFKYLYMLVGIGVNKNYCSFFVMSPGLIKQMKTELNDLKVSGSTIHFMPDQLLPKILIKKIVKARIKENEERAKSKNKLFRQF